MEVDLRTLQRDAIVVMFNLNNRDAALKANLLKATKLQMGVSSFLKKSKSDRESLATSEPIWKVLVYDQKGQDVISPLLKVNELRENGITVHMQLTQDRFEIPDVPAIYFVEPTLENLQLMTRDFQKELYDSYYINFTHGVSRDVLEQLAASSLETNAHQKIAQVYDQYLNFVCNESRMFSSGISDSFLILNSNSSTEADIQQVVNKSLQSLFSVIVTMGVVPIIRCQKGSASEMLGRKLDQKLRDHFAQSSSDPANSHAQRPVLILLDRNIDLTSMLQHTWNYATLVHDVLGLKSSRIAVQVEEQNRSVKKVYDLDSNDFFWQKNAAALFPQVAEDVDAEINRYKVDIQQVTRSANVSSLNELDGADFGTNTNALKAAITQLPELTERKRIIDMHMNIATSLLNFIQQRNLDKLFELEEGIVTKAHGGGKPALSFSQVLEHLKSDEKASVEDKLRLFLVYYLATSTEQDLTKDEWAQVEATMYTSQASVAALNYVRQLRSFGRMAANAGKTGAGSASGQSSMLERTRSAGLGSGLASGAMASNYDDAEGHGGLFNPFSSLSTHLSSQLKDKSSLFSGVGGAYSSIVAGFKNLMPARKDLTITRVVEALMDGGAVVNGVPNHSGTSVGVSRAQMGSGGSKCVLGDDNDDFLYLDPKQQANYRSRTPAQAPAGLTFKHAIVYVSGGGNYHEYQNLVAFSQKGVAASTAGGPLKVADDSLSMTNLLNLGGTATGLSGQQTSSRVVTYGATDIVSPSSFLRQLDLLGGGSGLVSTDSAKVSK